MWQSINRRLEKALPFLTPASVVAGIWLSDELSSHAVLVPWLFAFMTFSGSLRLRLAELKEVLIHPGPIVAALCLLHFVIPLWAFGLGHLFFGGDRLTVIGFVLAAAIPTGVTSFIWVSLGRGNLALALSIILIDTFLSPLAVPLTLLLLAGSAVEMDVGQMMLGLVFMIILPSLSGMLVGERLSVRANERLAAVLSPFSKLALALVVMMNSAVVAPYFGRVDVRLFFMAFLVLVIASSGYFLSWMAARWLKFAPPDIITLTFTGGMRNISAGAVLAMTYFPPPVSVPVVLGMLFQQVLASLYHRLLNKTYHSPMKSKAPYVGSVR
ncbi:bile acid:sodium symporter family protein [Geobacillus thermodenitrificans]|uniref:bile acid:sodium symporter family protein n=1 Tax=Geobacillus TaxID=129337 RepID=UPI000A28F305|nr:bile acid:sodium symporter family protein [Geobacillus thermodenitrificans]ARP43040.1 putative sodium-dependent transporter YocS [Geobacillus thermodenitrificans]MED3906760.1 bile acid:sodium symporter family protein [Geobacillus thermodenitrificans]